MIKIVTLLKRKPGMSRAAFIAHYEQVHAPLARIEVAAAIAADEENLFDRTCINAYVVEEHRSSFNGE